MRPSLGRVYEGVSRPAQVKRHQLCGGRRIDDSGFLDLAAGLAEKNLPLIVLPHGGPAAADTLDFDWWAQALAAQGYAVLQPNFRGSSSGLANSSKPVSESGAARCRPISPTACATLHSQGIDRSGRVCIVGASYGGYAALAGVDAGAGRLSLRGFGGRNLRSAALSQLDRCQANRHGSQRYWDRFMGVADQNDPALHGDFADRTCGRCDVPVLLIHGRDDTVVPFEQSDVMLSALKRAGKSVELVTMKHEDHWLSRSETRLQMLQATVDFLKANNPPD